MLNKEKYTLDYIRDNNLIIFDAVGGSHAYGTATKDSDVDKRGIFIMKKEDLYGLDYVEQVSDEKNDTTYYEIGRFFDLLLKSNPNILEIAGWMPEDCVTYEHPVYQLIRDNKWNFLSKGCKNSFGEYAKTQCKKAKGQDKMMNWEKNRVTRKTPLDFCYVVNGHKSHSLIKILKEKNLDQKFCGLVNIPNCKDMHALFYDFIAHYCLSENISEETRTLNKSKYKGKFLKYKGIVKEDEKGKIVSNALRLSSIPKDKKALLIFSYNKDGYTKSAIEYKNYQTWLKNRNKARYIDVKNANQKIDGKNLLHCMRLSEMSLEIANGQGVLVRRSNAEELLKIRKGKVDLNTLIDIMKAKMETMDDAFAKSELPDSVNAELVNNLLTQIRNDFYEN